MGFAYDPTDTSEFNVPVVGVPTKVTIGEGEDTESNAGNKMLVINVKIDQGEEGAGYKTKEYLVDGVNWKIRQVMRSCGLDPDKDHIIDDMFFHNKSGIVIFKTEEWAGNDGNLRTSYKIDKWVPKEEPTENETAQDLQDTPEPEPKLKPDYSDDIPF